ncbi:aminotransferase class I/II-fold pyridoxal phosphate-dependent enzyme [Cyanobium sp. CH-040]|uniref:aminotransferase class I/II-fold pyridoxal phosphate-dependent enzyme n=1 Tax=Cyanobium sp. CH-040 TaxID=2823708 RepID=UPI0020CE5280|nr:lysine decarboxylase [Cyanobium sp. CH-040]
MGRALRARWPGPPWSRPLELHLPAHGRGRGLAPDLAALLRQPPGSWDLPELPAIGGLLEPVGAVADAQRACAELLGAERCWFGVNGASGLLQAALLALAPPGSRVLLPRNLHRSLLHGCVLGQLRPVLFNLPFDPASGLWRPPDAPWLERVLAAALAQGPLAAVVLVSPTYQGFSADLVALTPLVHAAGLPLLVDQAHGGGEALAAGADLVVLSCQKAGGGLAQSAALLAQGPRHEPAAIARSLLWLQTSSPSALLLASAEAALRHAGSPAGRVRRRRAEAVAARLKRRCAGLGLPLLRNHDPLRLVLHTAALGINGLQADRWLLERGVIAELPEPGALTFCLGEVPPPGVARRLPRALAALVRQQGGDPLAPFSPPPLPLVAEPELALDRAWRAPALAVSLAEAAGHLAAEPLCPYPPGIPLLVPGERIDAARAAWLAAEALRWPGQIADTVKVVAS